MQTENKRNVIFTLYYNKLKQKFNMQKRRLLLAMLLCAFWLTGFAQNAIKGTVKDKSGEPLIGVSVTYGSGQGTVTDIDGNFSVNVL